MLTLLLSIALFAQVAAPGVSGCQPKEWPIYRGAYADLYATLGPVIMGYPTSCEIANDLNSRGDTFQRSSTGSAYWIAETNTVRLTLYNNSGSTTIRFELTPDGVRAWLITVGTLAWAEMPPDAPLFKPD